MMVKKLRLQHGWSQDQLSQFSGLSLRTIQRIEKGQKAGLESLKSLAAVFDVQITQLQEEFTMEEDSKISNDEKSAIRKVQKLKHFYSQLIIYLLVIGLLFAINFFTNSSYIWAIWPAMGWGIGIIIKAFKTFEIINFFGSDWEESQIKKELSKKS